MLKESRQWVGRNWIGAVICLVLVVTFLGIGYSLGRRSVPQEMKVIQAANTAPAPWNPGTDATGLHPLRSTPVTSIPANATPEMKEFLQNRAALTEKMEQMHGQGTNGAPNPQGFAQFQKDYADLLKRQGQLAQIISQQQAQNPLPTPPPLKIPPGASPQLTAFLTTRDQLMRDQVAFMNQHRADDPATRQAAMQQWHQQNADRFQQLQQEAKAMAQNTPTTQPPTTTTK